MKLQPILYKWLSHIALVIGLIATLPIAHATPHTWNGWTFDFETGVLDDGLALTNVSYQNHKLFKRVSLAVDEEEWSNHPFSELEGQKCQTNSFIRFRNNYVTPIPWANNVTTSQRQFSKDGRDWYEIGVYMTFQGREYFQAFYLSKDGIFDAHLYKRGWSCPENETSLIYWWVDADIDGADSDAIDTIDATHANFLPRTVEFSMGAFSYDDLSRIAFQFKDIVTHSTAVVSLAGLNFPHPDGNLTQTPRLAPQDPHFKFDLHGILTGVIAKPDFFLIAEPEIEPEDLFGKDVAGRFINHLTPVKEYYENPQSFSQRAWFTNSFMVIPSWTYTQPDVMVDEVHYDGAYNPTIAGALGNVGRYTVTIRNLGAATPADKLVGVGFFIDGVFKTSVSTKPLRPGEIRTLTSTELGRYQIPGGNHTITAWVDDVNRFAESHEDNNTLNKMLSVPAGPAVKIITPVANSTVSGAAVVLSARASDPTGVRNGVSFYIDGQFVGSKWSSPYTLTWDSSAVTEGLHLLTVIATGKASSTSGANALFKVVHDANSLRPDITVSSLSYGNGAFAATIKNSGAGAIPAGVPLGLSFYADGKYVSWGRTDGPIASGESRTLNSLSSFSVPSGTHVIKVIADDQGSVMEADEANNVMSNSITVP